MLKVGDIYYSGVMRIVDSNADPVTGLVTADFDIEVYKDGVLVVAPIISISELSVGNYQAQFTPANVGAYTTIIVQTTYSPDGWTEGPVYIHPADADLEYTGALCTLAEIKDALKSSNFSATDTSFDDEFTRLISSVTSEIQNYTQQQFISKTITDEYYNIEDCQDKIFTNYMPIYSVTSIYENGVALTYNADPTLTEYTINNEYIQKAIGYFYPGHKKVKISYVAFKPVPYEIKEVAIQMVCIRSGKKIRTYTDGDGIVNAVVLTSVPADLYKILDRYKRIIF